MKQLGWFGRFVLVLFLNAGVWASPVRLRCEYRVNPLGVDKAAPQLSWQSDSSTPNWKQAGYQILVASSESGLSGKADIWDSGRVDSGISVGIRYSGPKLSAAKRYFWKVRVWDAKGEASESAEPAWWEMGLLDRADWKAEWIHRPDPEFSADRAAMLDLVAGAGRAGCGTGVQSRLQDDDLAHRQAQRRRAVPRCAG